MTSVHSNSCHLALEETIPMNVKLSRNPYDGVAEFLKKTVDWVVQINKVEIENKMKRQITEILQPTSNYYWDWQKGESASGLPSFLDQNGEEGKKVH